MAKTHWLYGRGPKRTLKFNVEVGAETPCSRCIHKEVCDCSMERRCSNYEFGTSVETGCGGCLHRFTRYDKDCVPCFHCKNFKG